jgi:hypothetical protein
MKSRKMLTVLAAIAALTMILAGFASCKNDTSGGDDGLAKTLVVTGIPGSPTSARVGVFPVGTTPQQAVSQTGIVAGADSNVGSISFSSGTATIRLYLPDGSDVRWTGSGTYDIYCQISDGSTRYYRKTNVSITSGTTTLAWSVLEEVSIQEN